MKKQFIPFIMLVITMVIWGADVIGIQVSVGTISPSFFAFARILAALAAAFVIHMLFNRGEKIKKIHRRELLISGVIGMALYWYLESKAISYTSGSLYAIMLALLPIGGLISDRLIFKHKITVKKIIGICVSIIGVIIVITGAENAEALTGTVKGFLLTIIAILCWTVYLVASKPLFESYSVATALMYQMLIGVICLAPFAVANIPAVSDFNMGVIGLIFFNGMVCTTLAELTYGFAIRYLNLTIVTTFENLVPAISIAISYLVFKTMPTGQQLIGAVIIIAAVIMISLSKDEKIDTLNGPQSE
ncbi:MAG: DMT family transporter [Firmicutes bacterium]|nr:DMT family transporter [Bacillota bacterium]